MGWYKPQPFDIKEEIRRKRAKEQAIATKTNDDPELGESKPEKKAKPDKKSGGEKE